MQGVVCVLPGDVFALVEGAGGVTVFGLAHSPDGGLCGKRAVAVDASDRARAAEGPALDTRVILAIAQYGDLAGCGIAHKCVVALVPVQGWGGMECISGGGGYSMYTYR